MERNIVFKRAKHLRRIGAAIIDLIVVFVLFVVFFLIVDEIFISSKQYKENLARHSEILVESGLYEMKNDNVIYVENDKETKIITFLNTYTDQNESYLTELKSKSELFTCENNVCSIKVDAKQEEITKFYNNVIDKISKSDLFNQYLKKFEDAEQLLNYFQAQNTFKLMTSVLLALLIYYMIVPMIRKDHNTFGRLMFKLRVYSKKGGLEPTKLQIAFRELVYIFFEMILSFYTITMFYGIPITLVISLCMVFFTKYNQSFHDLCCSTIVVDDEVVQNNTRESEKIYLTIIEDDKEEK